MFIFQAEDGIRDIGVTGVQTCALPIFQILGHGKGLQLPRNVGDNIREQRLHARDAPCEVSLEALNGRSVDLNFLLEPLVEIGRVTCRERVSISVVVVSLEYKNLSVLMF